METVTLELRPRLRSLSAYISLIKEINTDTIRVKLLEEEIQVEIENIIYTLPLSGVIKLLPSSLSSLGITSRWITFRVQTQPDSFLFGTFETEIIDNLRNDIDNKLSFGEKKINQQQLPTKNIDSQLICTCCKNHITRSVAFKRILPLPSIDCDPQDWYCCINKHQHDDQHEKQISLDPGELDFFYSFNYCVLNKCVFQENLIIKNSLVRCNRCLTIIGSSKGENKKLWNCCIEYKSNEHSIKGSPSFLNDFLNAVKSIASLTIGEQILFEAKDVNSVHFLLLRPMESKLNIFTQNKINSKLDSLYVVKVLYKYGESEKTIVNNYSDAKYSELALPSILAGLDELISWSKKFPPVYRKADDFYMGYLPVV